MFLPKMYVLLQWGLCALRHGIQMGAVRIRHSIWATQPVILWILLGGKQKWLPLNFGFNDVMRTAPISMEAILACHPARSTE